MGFVHLSCLVEDAFRLQKEITAEIRINLFISQGGVSRGLGAFCLPFVSS